MHHIKLMNSLSRAESALLAVLPRSVEARIPSATSKADLIVNGHPVTIKWIGEGYLGNAKALIEETRDRPDIAVARLMSPGARQTLSEAGIGWIDETGAAEIAIGTIIVSRSGSPQGRPERSLKWSPAVLAVAEAILCGVRATVSETHKATGLSTGSCTRALRILTEQNLLESNAGRGPTSARRVRDPKQLLNSYAREASSTRKQASIQVGVSWRDPVEGLEELGKRWSRENVKWACTGLVAASVIAPLITSIATAVVYIDATSIVGLEALSTNVGLRPITGGRLTLEPFPTQAVRNMSKQIDGLIVAPWPRVYADLLNVGVRGEEAADHLFEIMNG